MAHTYSELYELPTTGLDFLQFMDHGEPDMALFKFTNLFLKVMQYSIMAIIKGFYLHR